MSGGGNVTKIITRIRAAWRARQRELRLCRCRTEDPGGPYDMPRTRREDCPVHGPPPGPGTQVTCICGWVTVPGGWSLAHPNASCPADGHGSGP